MRVLLALPFLLIASTALVFRLAALALGAEAGYLLGFAFYWGGWCWLAPRLILGRQAFRDLLADRTPLFHRRNAPAALLWFLVTGVAGLMYGRAWIHAPAGLILAAIPLASLNGFCEELLWRGVYVRVFPGNGWLGLVYPSVGFALWHFVPQMIFPADDRIGFVVSTFFLGLAYAFIAFRTGSARWTAISHSLNGSLALADPLARLVLGLLSR